MDYIKDKSVIVTGISKGIGAGLCGQLLERGAKVIGWGLHTPAYSNPSLHFIQCDISREEETILAAAATREITSHIDFVINNAGLGIFRQVENLQTDQFMKMFMVNVAGAFYVTRQFAGSMKARGSGHIINISSIAGRVGAPWGSGYNTSKFALSGFSESLFHELRQSGIKVTTVYPGATRTEFFNQIEGGGGNPDFMLDPADVAATVVHLMDTPPNYLVREIEIRPLNSKKNQ